MVNLLRCVEVANVCVAVLDVTDTTILEHVFVMLAVETEVDMDAIRINLFTPTSTSWLTADSPDLLKPITSLGLPTGPCESTIHVRLSQSRTARCIPDSFVRPIALAASPSDSHGRPSQARSNAGPAHVDQQSSSSAVQQREIDNNLLMAMEYTPEAFTRFTMLYVDCEINRHSVKAYVDSGAEMSIMNVATTERCGIMRLLDTRMSGVAIGIGEVAILGRIHFVMVNLAGMFIPFCFDVLEDLRYDMIIGLDQLRRHLMQIDLKHNCLRIEDIEVPFLPESQLPQNEKPCMKARGVVEAPKQDNEATKRRPEPRAGEGKARGTAASATGKSAGSCQHTAKLTDEMEKAVRQREIDDNMLMAMEYTPEAFTRRTMLYVDCEINHHPVKAFVDSGAQISFMNVATAERCGIVRLLDTRMKNVAKGVGQQTTLGRIHFVTVNLAGLFIPFCFSVRKNDDCDIIIGLDQMRRHLMQIDLKHNCLRIEDIEVPFLPESQLPERAKLNVEASTMVEAPKPDNEATTAGQEQRAREGTGHGKAAPAAPAAASASQAGGEPATAPAPARQAESLSPEQHAALDQLTTLTGGAYPRAALIAVLEAAGWNVETAATLLFEES